MMQPLVYVVGLLMAVAVSLSGCTGFSELSEGGVDMAQVPVTAAPTDKTHPGKFIWHDLLTPDAVSAAEFYQQLFGWQVEFQGQYAVVSNGDKPIAGILQVEPPAGKTRDGVWIPSVSVADVDAAVSRVKAGGGTILKGPLDMAKRGRAVMISDPQRADLVLLAAKGGDPADSEAGIGDWLWDEIWTDNPETIDEFYSQVLGYEKISFSSDYDVFTRDGQWRAGIRHLQDPKHMLWVPVVRVTDPYATVRRVKELGGVVWITPDEAPGNGSTALIADTTGALLLIQRWPVQLTEEEN